MAPTAGFLAVVKTAGTSTATTAEPTTDGGAHTAYQITNTAKRVLDPAVAVVVYKDAVEQASSLYTLDYLTGTVTFATPLAAEAVVTITANYLPLLTVATARDVSFSSTRERIDVTPYQTSQYRVFKAGMLGVEGTLGLVEFGEVDHDSGAGTVKFTTLLDGFSPVFLEIAPATTGNRMRLWAVLTKGDHKTPMGGVAELNVGFSAAGNGVAAPVSWAA